MLDRLNQTEKMNKASGDIFNWSSYSLPRKVFPSKIRLTLYPNLTTRIPTNKIYVYHNAYIMELSTVSVEFWVVKLKSPIIWNNHLLWLPWRIHVPFPLLRRLQMECDTAFGCMCTWTWSVCYWDHKYFHSTAHLQRMSWRICFRYTASVKYSKSFTLCTC